MTRRRLSDTARVALFLRHDGICHICGSRIIVGERWEVEHVLPLAQGGEDDDTNTRPAHAKCHRVKTAKDAADTAKAKRREARHIGAHRSARPMPGGKSSKWKRKISGEIVAR
jgi:5-methylcytosine-specific restriction enzyme A